MSNNLDYYYDLISKNEDNSNDLLLSLTDLAGDNRNVSTTYNLPPNNDVIPGNLPKDFVEAVFCLSQKEFWDCFRFNTFKEFKQCPHVENVPTTDIYGLNGYKDWIYSNRCRLLYLTRFQMLTTSPFMNTLEAIIRINKYYNIYGTEKEDPECQEQEQQEDEEEEDYEESKRYKKYKIWRDNLNN